MARYRDENDIKAPDGYTLGGLRTVRKGGFILFNRVFWEGAPDDWVGERVWVHEDWKRDSLYGSEKYLLDVANPGLHIFEAWNIGHFITLKPSNKPDAKPAYRKQSHKDYAAQCARQSSEKVK